MNNQKYIETNPTSRKDLIEKAKLIRQVYNVTGNFFPILDILNDLSLKNKLDYIVVEDDSELFVKDELAHYDFNDNLIYVKTSVWAEAEKNIGRSRFTLTHEFAHYLLLNVFGFGYKLVDVKPQAFKDPDWQADYLAAALLMDFDLTQGFTVEQLITECGVSEEAALVHISAVNALKLKPRN